ncbi:MAG: hypothetical protein D6682_08415 [Zetaproteobacteria bacterium]|nr:MAG: hypothetical protein D6682_08415 [Zetaproteobacteria bacterium]
MVRGGDLSDSLQGAKGGERFELREARISMDGAVAIEIMNDEAQRDDAAVEPPATPVRQEWGRLPEDHFGYASDEERIARRGLEDWELVEQIPKGQKRVPRWFIAVVFGVGLVAFTLTLPFWGDRPDHPRPWFTWGHLLAVVYFLIGAGFIHFMINQFAPAEKEDDPSQGGERSS